jgi:hypothetical protein
MSVPVAVVGIAKRNGPDSSVTEEVRGWWSQGTPYQVGRSADLLAGKHAAAGGSGPRVVVLLGAGVDGVELVIDEAIDGLRRRG